MDNSGCYSSYDWRRRLQYHRSVIKTPLTNQKVVKGKMCKLKSLLSVFKSGNPSGNIPSPRVDIKLSESATGILLEGLKTITVQNSNSMEPLIDIGHTVLISDKIDDLKEGDIIIWQKDNKYVIHSIIECKTDEGGDFYRTQGLNVNQPDVEIIRKLDIKYLCVGVLWTREVGSYIAINGD